ncbi:MAG: RNA 2',3'-cyclic phosphodiesterase [Acidobacteriota bacterium]
MRLFIGIKLSEQVKEKLCEICRDLKDIAPKVKWVKEDNIHITLKFLGETEKKDQIIDILTKNISVPPFKLKYSGIGKFGIGDELRILWAGIHPSDELSELFSQMEKGMEQLDFPGEKRKFSPHITLGRNKYGKMLPEFRQKIEDLSEYDFGEQEITSFQLIKSKLVLSGPIYSTLSDFPL